MTNPVLAAAERVQAAAQAPTSELGSQTRLRPIHGISGLTVGLLQEQEYADAWRWPRTWQTVDRMRNDAQIEALWTAISLSIRRRNWLIEPNGAPDAIVETVSREFNLPIRGDEAKPRPRAKGRFSWKRHIEHVLLSVLYGFYPFEQVGHIGDDGLWHLDKLAPRPPRTVMYASTDDDGGLASISQYVGHTQLSGPVEIPVGRLVMYVWDQEGANWYGRSMLRSIHREFDIKDRLIKVDAVKHQRNGMGIPMPHVTQPTVGTGAEAAALAMASQLRAGEDAAGVMPYGMEMRILGVQGQLPDTLASIQHCDESMARRFLAMFAMLGQTSHGSRALGESFVDFFGLALDAIAEWACDTTNEHAIEDFVDWNYGEGEPLVPLVVSESTESAEAAIDRVLKAVGEGAITMDAELEAWLRKLLGAPARSEDAAPAAGPARLVPAAASRARKAPRAAAGVKLPAREMRREPLAFEVAAAVDFAGIEAIYETGLSRLLREWATIRTGQIDELATQIAAAATDEALASVQASPAGGDLLLAEFMTAVQAGAQQAVDEAAAQGADAAMPDIEAMRDRLTQRADAVAITLSRSLSEAAGRQALARAGGTLTTAEIADDVRGHLETLSDQYLVDQFTGVISQGMNTGRRTVIATASPIKVYASELLDANTCEVCADADGREYATLEDAEQDYPAGGNAECLGGPRCRGSLVAVYGEAEPTG